MKAIDDGTLLQALRRPEDTGPADAPDGAIEALREYLLRAVLLYLRNHRSDVAHWAPAEVRHFAEDVAQESLLTIRDRLDDFQGRSRFTTWAYRCAINRAAYELRLKHGREVPLEGPAENGRAHALEMACPDRALDPAVAAERADCLRLLSDVIHGQLTPRQRRAFLAVYVHGLSMDEVAAELGIRRNALYKLLHDARRKLKRQIEKRQLITADLLTLFEG